MATFNPNSGGDSNLPSYTGYSRGIDAARPADIGGLIEQAGQAASNIVTAIDMRNKRKIDKFVEGGVEGTREVYNANDTMGYETGAEPFPVESQGPQSGAEPVSGVGPSQPTAETENATRVMAGDIKDLQDLQTRYEAGVHSRTDYLARLNAIVKGAKSRWPGYSDYIDNKISSITGITPANAMIAEQLSQMDQAQAARQSELDRQYQYLKQGEFDGNPVDWDKWNANPDQYFREYQYSNGAFQANKAERQRLQDEYNLDKAKRDFDGREAIYTANGQVDLEINSIFIKSGREIASQIDAALNADGVIPPETIDEIGRAIDSVSLRMMQRAQEYLYAPIQVENSEGVMVTTTMAAQMGPEARDALLKGVELRMKGIKDSFINDQTGGLFKKNVMMYESMQNADARWLTQKYPVFRMLGSIQKVAGQSAADVFTILNKGAATSIQNEIVTALEAMQMQMSAAGHADPETGKPISARPIEQYMDDAKQLPRKPGETDKQYQSRVGSLMRQATISAANGLRNPEINDEHAMQFARTLFGTSDGTDFLKNFKPKNYDEIWKILTSPDVQARMQQLGAKNPEYYKNYQKWAMNTYMTVFAGTAATIKEAQYEDRFLTITFDPSLKAFVTQTSPELMKTQPATGLGITSSSEVPVYPMEQIQVKETKALVELMNTQLQNLVTILENNPNGAQVDSVPIIGEAFAAMGLSDMKKINPDENPFGAFLWGEVMKGAVPLSEEEPDELEGLEGVDEQKGSGQRSDAGVLENVKDQPLQQVAQAQAQAQQSPDTRQALEALAGMRSTMDENKYNLILNAIQKGEAPGGANQRVFEDPDNPKYDLVNMTIDEVLALPANKAKGMTSTSSGLYQIKQSTLREQAKKLKLPGDTLFNEETQQKIAISLLRKRGLDDFLDGTITREEFLNELSQEWASVPNEKGKSHYKQPVAHTPAEILALVDNLKTQQELIDVLASIERGLIENPPDNRRDE